MRYLVPLCLLLSAALAATITSTIYQPVTYTQGAYLSFPLSTSKASYTMLQPGGTETYAVVFSGECFPYGLTATAISFTETEIINVGTVNTVATELVPVPQNVATMSIVPDQLNNIILKVFCVNAGITTYKMVTEVNTITTSGPVYQTFTYSIVKTYLVPTVTPITYPNGITAYVTTYTPTNATFLTTSISVTTVSGTIVTTKTLLLSLAHQALQGLEVPAEASYITLSAIPTVITVIHNVFGFTIPLTLDYLTSETVTPYVTTLVTGNANVPAPALIALLASLLSSKAASRRSRKT